MITSSQNAKIKLVRALNGRSKERRQTGAFLAEGIRLVEEAFAADWPFRFALFSNDLGERGIFLRQKLEEKGVEIEEVESRLLGSSTETETSQGILAVLDENQLPLPASPDFVLIPDSIRDPGNLGTLLRSADAAGVQAALLPPETADAFAPKVVRAGMGAHFRLPIHTLSWHEIENLCTSANLQGFLADMDGESCWEADLRAPLALIVGGEARGASPAARKLFDKRVGIPMAGTTESLNAAIAGSVLMFEVKRQRSSTATGAG